MNASKSKKHPNFMMYQNPKTKQKIQPYSTPKQWPNLPQNLISSIARNPKLMNNITSFGCVLKTWRSVPLKCTPESDPGPKLVEIGTEKDHINHIIEIPFHRDYPCWYNTKKALSYRYESPPINFIGHSHELVIAMEANSLECCLCKPSSYGPNGIFRPRWRYGQYLPPWNSNVPFKLATLSSQLNDPNGCNVMVITGISCPAFPFFRYRKNQKAWILQDCKEKERYGIINESMEFTNCIGFRGKFYALSLQGTLVVIEEDVDSRFRVSRIGESRAVPTGVSRQFREYLVELNGEVFLVFLVSRKSIDFVEGVEVFRLDFGKLLWVKVESLGCMALFLEDECCMGVNASELERRENCIYFTHSRVKESWYVYEMERDEISEWCLAK